jgi:hypothetical protein
MELYVVGKEWGRHSTRTSLWQFVEAFSDYEEAYRVQHQVPGRILIVGEHLPKYGLAVPKPLAIHFFNAQYEGVVFANVDDHWLEIDFPGWRPS